MIKLSAADVRAILPRAPQVVVDAFASKQNVLVKADILETKVRAGYFFANIEHESGGFSIPGLTENINYTAARMAQVWPSRFPGGAAQVRAKYGTSKGWQLLAFDDIYGNRMGNRPGTSDGSMFIGRGGPQWTGRDGYEALQKLTGLPVVADPELASRLDLQPEICAAFWTWKGLNRFADAGNFIGCVTAWNGGTNGLADRKALMAGNDPIIKRLESVSTVMPTIPAAPLGARVGVTISNLNVRAGTGTNYPVLRIVPKGTKVNALEQLRVGSVTWLRIDDGFVSAPYVKLAA